MSCSSFRPLIMAVVMSGASQGDLQQLPYAGDVGIKEWYPNRAFKTKTASGAKGNSNEPERPSAPKLAAPLR